MEVYALYIAVPLPFSDMPVGGVFNGYFQDLDAVNDYIDSLIEMYNIQSEYVYEFRKKFHTERVVIDFKISAHK